MFKASLISFLTAFELAVAPLASYGQDIQQPIESKIEEPSVSTAPAVTVVSPSSLQLSGHATHTIALNEIGSLVSDLLSRSLDKNEQYIEIVKEKNKKHRLRKVASKVSGVVQEVITVNPTSASKDGAKIALDDIDDWEDRDSLNYREQRIIDELHPKLASALLQVAMGAGDGSHSESAQAQRERGLEEISRLSGSEARAIVEAKMQRWIDEVEEIPHPDRACNDLIGFHKDLNILTKAAVSDDPAITEITKELRGYAAPKKWKDFVNCTLQTMLDTTAYLMPSAQIAAAVEAVKGVLVTSTGGSEDDKLQHLMHLLKRVTSRKAALNEEIQIALYGRELGIQTKNVLLIRCSKALIGNLVTPTTVDFVASHNTSPFAKVQ